MSQCNVYVDFDGTIAPNEPTLAMFTALADPNWRSIEADWQAGHSTSREYMQKLAQQLNCTPEEMDSFLDNCSIDPKFKSFVEVCNRNDARVHVVSDGFEQVVGRLLANADLPLPFYANRLVYEGNRRWSCMFPHTNESCRLQMGNCKCSHQSATQSLNIMIGDGRSDFCIAERSDYVLAKGRLAAHCEQEGLPHERFSDFTDATQFIDDWFKRQSSKPAATVLATAEFPQAHGLADRIAAASASHRINASEHTRESNDDNQKQQTGIYMSNEDHSIRYEGGRMGFLLIQGLGGTPLGLRYVARGLARAGHTVHCPQLAGHCGTYEELRATGWTDWYATCEEALKEMRKKCDVVVVGGLSAGAILSLNLAADYPDHVDATVLFAPTLKLDGWGVPWYARFFRLVTQRWCADLFPFAERDPFGLKDERVRALATEAMQAGDSSKAGQAKNPGSVMLEMRWLIQTVRSKLRIIKQPALIIHPREDDRASLGNTAYLQKHLGGIVDTLVLDDSYHVVTMDKQRDLVVARTVAYADWLNDELLPDDKKAAQQPMQRTA